MAGVFDNAFPSEGGGGGTYPTESQVLEGISFGPAGNDFTGNVHLPPVTWVLEGYTFGANRELVGAWAVAGVDDVRDGVAYGNAGAQVGNLVLPLPADVRQGTVYDSPNSPQTGTLDPGAGGTVPHPNDVRSGVAVGEGQTGALVLPAVTDVRSAVNFDAPAVQQTGTCVVPAAADVQTGVSVDVSPTVGTFDSPLASTVEAGTTYGNAGEFTGTLDIDVRANLPATSDVVEGVTYGEANDVVGVYHTPEQNEVWNAANFGPNSSITGTNRLPAQPDVRIGVVYGPDDTITGGLDTTSDDDYPTPQNVRDGVVYSNGNLTGNLVVPAVGDVRDGVSYDTSVVPSVGVLDLPGVGDVRQGVQFDNSQQTGTLDPYTEANVPTAANVRFGVTFGNAETGILDLPAPSDVRKDVSYDNNTKTGTLIVGAGTPVYPGEESVLLNVQYGTDGILEFTGNYRGAPEENVLAGFAYGSNDSLTGTLQPGCYPDVADVRSGVVFGCSNEYVGTHICGTTDPGDVEWIG